MQVVVDGEGTFKASTWIPSPAMGAWASVELDDGLPTISSESLMGAINVKGSGIFSSEGMITSGLGRGSFTAKGLTGGDFEFTGTGEPGTWSGMWVYCSCP